MKDDDNGVEFGEDDEEGLYENGMLLFYSFVCSKWNIVFDWFAYDGKIWLYMSWMEQRMLTKIEMIVNKRTRSPVVMVESQSHTRNQRIMK